MDNLRNKLINFNKKEIQISNLYESNESKDKYTIINCNGYGRIRKITSYGIHYSSMRFPKKKFIRNESVEGELITQVFQIAGCNWRCWYCFVDKELVCGNEKRTKFFSCDDLIELYLKNENKSYNIDLSGGNPDIAPEWCLWFMKSLEKCNLKGIVSLWVDDNLGTDYLFTKISKKDREYMASFPKHVRLCCIKGYDDDSIIFNVRNKNASLKMQLKRLEQLIQEGFEVIVYLTFVGPKGNISKEKIETLFYMLYNINPHLPLRCIPIIIKEFTAQQENCSLDFYRSALDEQFIGFEYWEEIMIEHYDYDDINLNPQEVIL